ncbi:Ca2+-transporting ATPase [Olsenella sp. KH3B4]|uniref:cation-translocating P-type ATPase n=1 Tax=Olsenella sp. KH3B4 TaxID=1855394 RepID=UPI0008D100F0|nr:cation-translocating P-type ATPase [Olsenella sp. KH3B4]SES82899.1 Ca2+-transporting ATPase [Olsenella sp. KH3B4]
MKEYLQDSAQVIKDVASDDTYGLAADEAAARLEKNGLNKLKEAKKDPLWKRFFAQMADPMIIMLIVAAVISALTSMAQGEADFADVIIICFVVVVNAVLGVVQESKAEEALAALQEMSAAQSKVVRDGKVVTVPSSELVVGDLVILEAGDSVPADCRIIESASMKIEEAALTGESVPVNKIATVLDVLEEGKDVPLGDRKNMCYMGSTVVYGRGRAVVVATGMDTEMGKIADALTRAEDEETPLQKKLDELSKILSIICIVICALVFVVTWLKHGMGFFDNMTLVLNTFMVAVSLAVAAIPEGLAAVVTIVLSIGVTKMSEHNAIIRKLSAVETLGCTQVICSDKTGTLTQNKMTVVRHFTEDQDRLVRCMALCSDAKWDPAKNDAVGEPTEAALVADAAKLGFTSGDLDAANPRVGEAPFDSGRKMMSVVNKAPDGNYIQHTKGGPDVILARCTKVHTADGDVPLTDEWRQRIMEANKAMADDALRVMAAARVNYGKTAPADFSPEALEHDMTFLGLCGMIDPVRPEVKQAVAEAHSAGMRVVMITGDHIDTAVAIAKELGIIVDRSQAITGAELDRMSDEEFAKNISKYGVYARVQPEHKTRIVDTWKKLGKVVAMTGDGVNDAPSIKRADIGVGMGITGTDVTKNVADMVLADDNFATIINACEEGRRIYDNIRKSIAFLLSSNLAEVIAVFVASLVGFTILEPTHLLWLNLITDCFPALAMAMEEAEPGIMKRDPRSADDGIFANGMGLDCLIQGAFIGTLTLISYFIGLNIEGVPLASVLSGADKGLDGMTMAFLTLSMVEMFHSFNMRSRRQSIFKLPTQNKWLWFAFAGSLVLTFVVIETPLAQAFDFAEISAFEYGIAMLLAVAIIPLVEIYKAIMRAVEKGRN